MHRQAIPLHGRAFAILTAIGGGLSVGVSTKAWYQALRRAGIENFRWHDLRHTWANWHAQQGTPMSILQELGGWESAEMVRRYAHFSPHHLSPYADRLQGVGSGNENADGTFTAQL